MDVERLRQDLVFTETLRGQTLTFHSAWGLFSPRAVDEGTRLLLDHVEVSADDDCLDLGCGYGAIGLTLARLAPRGRTFLVDRDFVAVEYARRNAERNAIANCEVLLSDGFSHVPPGQRFSVVASNLPAKAGNEAYTILFTDAHARLVAGGRCYVVTLSAVRRFIERSFRELFGNYEKVKQGRTHTVSLAVREP
ncbi:MAG: methyltransferase domain-containing protein [Dehalococcoidia bacterium]|nr:methyltransferase domain-containing protein [Dehalococcoidia bacterium]